MSLKSNHKFNLLGLCIGAAVQAEAVAHAEHQGAGALHQDADVAQRSHQHGQAPGGQVRAEGGQQETVRR